jgi:uncharacterized protein (DUF1501 family)
VNSSVVPTLSRRRFLAYSGVAAAVAAAGGIGWKDLADRARTDPLPTGTGVLVVLTMYGGNDGLNTVVPAADPAYRSARPDLAYAEHEVLDLGDGLGLNPGLAGLKKQWDTGTLAIVRGVSYPRPDHSHFRSMDIWQTASLAENAAEGWLGKALKGLPATPAFHLKSNNQRAPLAFDGAPVRPPSINTLEEFQLQMAATSGADKQRQRAIIEGAAKPGGGKPNLLDFVQRTAANTYASSRRLQEIGKNYQPKSPYPNTPLAGRLKLAAQLIDADLGARIFYVSIGGFDTHATQAPAHANLMGQLSGAMTAFFKDVAARGHRDRVLLMTFSEFGRRVKENGSKGTDHGAAAPMLLVGGKVKAGPVGKHPSLEGLDANTNLKHHTDFRQVYAAVLDRWLGVPSKDVLGEAFKPVDVFKF